MGQLSTVSVWLHHGPGQAQNYQQKPSTAFPVLPDYLPLCGTTCVGMIIPPMPHEDLKHHFFIHVTGQRQVLKSGFTQLKLIYYCLPIQNFSYLGKLMTYSSLYDRIIMQHNCIHLQNDMSWWSTTAVNMFKPHC